MHAMPPPALPDPLRGSYRERRQEIAMIHHAMTADDRAAMTNLRARLAANPIRITRASFDQLVEQVPPAEGVTYSESLVGGVPGVWCTPASRREETAMLYLHGGVYLMGTAHAFRHFAGQLAARVGVPAFVADYRRAPESPFPAAFDDAHAAYRGLASRFGVGRVALVGDSAALFRRASATPPVQVHVGTAEILLDDALRLESESIEVHEWEGMPRPRQEGSRRAWARIEYRRSQPCA
jgi:acetyl esterase/lipase